MLCLFKARRKIGIRVIPRGHKRIGTTLIPANGDLEVAMPVLVLARQSLTAGQCSSAKRRDYLLQDAKCLHFADS